ncbi:MAG: phage tail sheath family protein, partial [Rhodospirillaceae bacterium]|nr:phage tail sheath family protein [Rhodospirillaceae bacterium]
RYTLGSTGSSPFQLPPIAADAGADGSAPGLAEFLGDPVQQTGFHALDAVDLFNLMIIPADQGIPSATQAALWGPASTYCADHRAFLLIDPPPDWVANGRPAVVANTTLLNDLRALVVKQNAAVFFPRVRINDRGLLRYLGPSGAIAGLIARIDATRGVWKAPAGVEADLRGIVDLEVNLTDLENGVLNKLAGNCLRKFPGGSVCWGARTLDGFDDNASEWKYIPVRRLALFLEESLYRGTKWVVFEPNDEPLWAKIRMNLNAFMMGLFRQGAFQGSTPDKAFYVKCDAETTTQNDRNLGIVNIEVGFAPLKPAEFVVIKIQQIAGDLA